MTKIPSWVWLIVGIGMYFISQRTGDEMKIFMYISLFFVVVGIFKMLVYFIVGNKKKDAYNEARDLRSQQYSCPRCYSIIASTHRFCPHCGTRLR